MSVLAQLAVGRFPPRPPATVVEREAEVSAFGTCRWTLRRTMRDTPCAPAPTVLPWILLNPSTADAARDDQTLHRIMGFSWRWGFDGCLVVNLFPYRERDPMRLADRIFPAGGVELGPMLENIERVARALAPFDAAIAAWGQPPSAVAVTAQDALLALLEAVDAVRATPLELFALGRTSLGYPTHPMARGRHRVPDDAVPVRLSREDVLRSRWLDGGPLRDLWQARGARAPADQGAA